MPQREICAHRRGDQLLERNMVEHLEKVIEDCSHRVPVCDPLAPRRLLPDAALNATHVRRPEEAFSVGGLTHFGLDPSKLAPHEHDGEEEADGPDTLYRLAMRTIRATIPWSGKLIQHPWWRRAIPQPSKASA